VSARTAIPTPASSDSPVDRGRSVPRGTRVQRARAGLVAGVSWLACRLPEGVTVRVAELAAAAWYRATPGRAAQARRNLRRVCLHLVATGRADERTTAAAADAGALEDLVRSAYRHAARYYLEVLRIPAFTPTTLDRRVVIETPDVVEEAFAADRPVVFVGLHLGSVELPGLYLARRTGRPTAAPMETIGDPALQDWFERTRARVGVRIVSLRAARRELLAALRRGETVGMIADRDVSGGGLSVSLFGAEAPVPVGPALLAIETGAPIYVAALRRAEQGRYRGRLIAIRVDDAGSRRERVTAIVTATAKAFEDLIADAPDQWWAVFFPIWPDLEARAS
jgi:KDO2-lipid IV(A) lauroyltransferase